MPFRRRRDRTCLPVRYHDGEADHYRQDTCRRGERYITAVILDFGGVSRHLLAMNLHVSVGPRGRVPVPPAKWFLNRIAVSAMATPLVLAGVESSGKPSGDPSVVQKTPGLVAFWTFGEDAGHPRVAVGGKERHVLTEVGGPIPRVGGGPFSGFSVQLNGQQYLQIRHAELGDLNIDGPDAQVSLFAVIFVSDVEHSRTVAGIWSEGKGFNDDTGTRQWALLMHMPAYGGARRLVPHVSSEGGMTRRADGTALGWNADYAATRSEVPEGRWCTVGFTYDSQYVKAYLNGVMERRALDPVKDKRNDRYFTHEGPGGRDRGMNPYYHGRGIFHYDPSLHATTKIPPSDFTVGARYAEGAMLCDAFRGKIGGLAVFERALTDAEMKRLHSAAGIERLAP